MVELKMLKPWTHFQPYEDMNLEANKFNLPHFDQWTCLVQPIEDGEKQVEQEVKILFFTDESNYHDDTDIHFDEDEDAQREGIVIVQAAEQYNGIWGSRMFEDLEDDSICCGNAFKRLVDDKLTELRISSR